MKTFQLRKSSQFGVKFGMLLAFATLPVAIAGAGVLVGVIGDGGGNGLVQISTLDASTTSLAPLGNGDDGEGIAYNPNDGLLYHTSGISDGSEFFETINPGAGFSVGPNLVPGDTYGPSAAQEISAIEWFQPLGVFLAMDRSSNWYHVTSTGEFSLNGSYDGADNHMRGLGVVGSQVYSIAIGAGRIDELDPSNGSVLNSINYTLDGGPALSGTGLAYDSDTGTLYGILRDGRSGLLASFDFNTSDFTTIGNLPDGMAGLTVIAAVPEASEISIFAMAVAGLIGHRRRRRK